MGQRGKKAQKWPEMAFFQVKVEKRSDTSENIFDIQMRGISVLIWLFWSIFQFKTQNYIYQFPKMSTSHVRHKNGEKFGISV